METIASPIALQNSDGICGYLSLLVSSFSWRFNRFSSRFLPMMGVSSEWCCSCCYYLLSLCSQVLAELGVPLCSRVCCFTSATNKDRPCRLFGNGKWQMGELRLIQTPFAKLYSRMNGKTVQKFRCQKTSWSYGCLWPEDIFRFDAQCILLCVYVCSRSVKWRSTARVPVSNGPRRGSESETVN